MFDLVVLEPKEYKLLKDRFPLAKVNDTSDSIHPNRLEVTLPDEQENDYLVWFFVNNLMGCSYSIVDMRFSNSPRLKELIKQAKVIIEKDTTKTTTAHTGNKRSGGR